MTKGVDMMLMCLKDVLCLDMKFGVVTKAMADRRHEDDCALGAVAVVVGGKGRVPAKDGAG